MPSSLSRRELVERCLSAGALFLAPALPLAVAMPLLADEAARAVTPHAELGPFYKKRSPETSRLRVPRDPGLPLSVSGLVFSQTGSVLHDATIEVWQADHLGHYDLEGYKCMPP